MTDFVVSIDDYKNYTVYVRNHEEPKYTISYIYPFLVFMLYLSFKIDF